VPYNPNCVGTATDLTGAAPTFTPTCQWGPSYNDVWYKFTATHTQHTIKISNFIANWPNVTVAWMRLRYTLNCSNASTCLQFPASGLITFNTTPGITYYLGFFPENIDIIARFNICVMQGSAAPITLLSFTAQKHPRYPDQSLLRFSTASERDNAGFDIERSPDGNKWVKIGYVVGHGTTAEQRGYDFTDSQPLPGYNYYRLRQTDYDGSFEYSPAVFVFFETGTTTVTVSPNPVADYLMLQPISEEESQVSIFDQNGGLVLSAILPEHENRIGVTHLLSGIYVAKWQTSTQQQVIRFVKQ
jgi:hypothetical protein